MQPRITTSFSFCRYRDRPDAVCFRNRRERKCVRCGNALGYFDAGDRCRRCRKADGLTCGKEGC